LKFWIIFSISIDPETNFTLIKEALVFLRNLNAKHARAKSDYSHFEKTSIKLIHFFSIVNHKNYQ